MLLHQRAPRAQRREIVPDAAARLHRQRGFLDVVENGAEIVVDRAHDEAIEQRDAAARAGARDDAAGRAESRSPPWPHETRRPILLRPLAALFDAGRRPRHAPERVVEAGRRRAVCARKAVLAAPDFLGNGGKELGSCETERRPSGAPGADNSTREYKRLHDQPSTIVLFMFYFCLHLINPLSALPPAMAADGRRWRLQR